MGCCLDCSKFVGVLSDVSTWFSVGKPLRSRTSGLLKSDIKVYLCLFSRSKKEGRSGVETGTVGA